MSRSRSVAESGGELHVRSLGVFLEFRDAIIVKQINDWN